MRTIVVANWKMNPQTFAEAKRLFEATRKASESAKNVSVIVAPPSIFLRDLATNYKGRKITFAAQNGHFDKAGAYTGEVSMVEVKDAKASMIIIGHSERRAMGETNEETRAKVNAALALKLKPILCIGEKKRSGSGEHFLFVKEQIRTGLSGVAPTNLSNIIIAYEPVWAIGGERTMDPRDMHEMAIFIRKMIVEQHGEKGMKIKIIYGGATTEQNAAAMLAGGDVVGLLVGHVSVDAPRFSQLISSLA